MVLLNDKRRLGSLLLLCFSLFYLLEATRLTVDPMFSDAAITARTLPLGLAVLSVLCALLQLFLPRSSAADEWSIEKLQALNWKPVLLLLALMFAYAQCFSMLGFILGGILLLFLGFVILGERRLGLAISLATVIVAGLWLLLTLGFDLQLEAGDLPRWVARWVARWVGSMTT